jgi:hypothetical protein
LSISRGGERKRRKGGKREGKREEGKGKEEKEGKKEGRPYRAGSPTDAPP